MGKVTLEGLDWEPLSADRHSLYRRRWIYAEERGLPVIYVMPASPLGWTVHPATWSQETH